MRFGCFCFPLSCRRRETQSLHENSYLTIFSLNFSPVLTGKVCARKVDESDAGRSRGGESMWGRLMDWNLSLWSEEQEFIEGALPLVQIPVNRDTCILEEGTLHLLFIDSGCPLKRKVSRAVLKWHHAILYYFWTPSHIDTLFNATVLSSQNHWPCPLAVTSFMDDPLGAFKIILLKEQKVTLFFIFGYFMNKFFWIVKDHNVRICSRRFSFTPQTSFLHSLAHLTYNRNDNDEPHCIVLGTREWGIK